MTFGSLFAGIGGFDLGFERAGLTCKWQVEIDDYCNRVLEKHWPDVPRWRDVRTFPPAGDWSVDVICGGFPCQDISAANYRGQGLNGARSGLWSEFARIIRVVRPRYAVIENVPALTFRGLDTVLSDLATLGYDAEWDTVSAEDMGAPHERARLFIVAYPIGERCEANGIFNGSAPKTAREKQKARLRRWPGEREPGPSLPDWIRWCPDRQLCRVVNELPDELDRYRVLGNAVLPDAAEWIGRQLMTREPLDCGRMIAGEGRN